MSPQVAFINDEVKPIDQVYFGINNLLYSFERTTGVLLKQWCFGAGYQIQKVYYTPSHPLFIFIVLTNVKTVTTLKLHYSLHEQPPAGMIQACAGPVLTTATSWADYTTASPSSYTFTTPAPVFTLAASAPAANPGNSAVLAGATNVGLWNFGEVADDYLVQKSYAF